MRRVIGLAGLVVLIAPACLDTQQGDPDAGAFTCADNALYQFAWGDDWKALRNVRGMLTASCVADDGVDAGNHCVVTKATLMAAESESGAEAWCAGVSTPRDSDFATISITPMQVRAYAATEVNVVLNRDRAGSGPHRVASTGTVTVHSCTEQACNVELDVKTPENYLLRGCAVFVACPDH